MTSTATTNSNAEDDMQPRIQIVGAGIAGLSLGSHLRIRKIPFKIFESSSKVKGHNYGITISSFGYSELLPVLEPRIDLNSFIKATAADRLVGGNGLTSISNQNGHNSSDEKSIRVSDASLREILSKNHNVDWDHRVTDAQFENNHLKLDFRNGGTNTTPITIDTGGDRHGLLSILLPDLKPKILPYAVYHGSRYVSHSDFTTKYNDLFSPDENVRDFTLSTTLPYTQPPTPTKVFIQTAKSHISHSDLPSPVRKRIPETSDPVVELRYTISRPALPSSSSSSSQHDPLFNPHRVPSAATTIPQELYTELSTLLTSNTSTIPKALQALLSPSAIESNEDRVLNWLLRLKVPSAEQLSELAKKGVLVIGDSAHALPILGSEGASLAMRDGKALADWLEGYLKGGKDGELDGFYGEMEMRDSWRQAEERARAWLRVVHEQGDTDSGFVEAESKL